MFQKAINSYRSLALPVKAALWFAVCSIIQKGIQFITVPIFTRLLTPSEFGEVALYNSWMGILVIFITLNLNAGTFNTGMVKYEENKFQFTSAMQSIVFLNGLFFLLLFFLFENFIVGTTGLTKPYLLLMLSQIVLFSGVSLWTTQQQYQYRYRSLAVVTLLITILTPALGVWAVMNYADHVAARIYSMAAVQIAIGVVFVAYNYFQGKIFFQKEYWKFALGFAIPLIPHYLSMVVLTQSDRVMIDWYCSKADVGVYSVAYSLAMVLMLVVSSIGQSLGPWTFKAIKRNNVGGLKSMSSVLSLLVAVPIVLLVLVAPELIALIAPDEYQEAVLAVPPVAVSCFFIFLYSLFGNIEFYFQKKQYIAVASVVGAMLNIALNWLLIPIYGYIAAAYTTLICYVGFSVAHYLFSRKISKAELGVKTIYDDKKLLLISIAMVFIGVFSPMLYAVHAVFRYTIMLGIAALVIYLRNDIRSVVGKLKSK